MYVNEMDCEQTRYCRLLYMLCVRFFFASSFLHSVRTQKPCFKYLQTENSKLPLSYRHRGVVVVVIVVVVDVFIVVAVVVVEKRVYMELNEKCGSKRDGNITIGWYERKICV